MRWTLPALHKGSVYVLVAIAFGALWLGGTFDLPIVLLCLAAGVASWFWEPPRVDFGRYARLWLPLTIAVLAGLVGMTLWGWIDLFGLAVGLVLYLTIAKLFQRELAKDYVQAMVLSFLLMAAATLFNTNLSFGLLFIVYVVVGLVGLVLYHLRVQTEQHPQAAHQVQLLDPRFLLGLVGLAGVAVLASMAFFFLFPRVGVGFLGTQSRPSGISTGFSEEVNLGKFGTLKTDTSVVMRIEFPDGSPPPARERYWRGVSFDAFNGQAWARTLSRSEVLRQDPRGYFVLTEWDDSASLFRQNIYLEPLSSRALFGLHPLAALRLSSPGRRSSVLFVSETGDVSYRNSRQGALRYEAISLLPRVDNPTQISREQILASLDPDQAAAYTRLPENFNARIRELAIEATQAARNDFDRAAALRQFLLNNYTYTVNLPDPGSQPPIDAFLFDHRRGHCEYFSTAYALMLRSLGIPARQVNGFIGGVWHESERYLAVRNADAHSWTEVPFGGLGWIRFDATPPAANVSQLRSWWDPVRNFYDALQFRWTKYVVQYNLEQQAELLRQAAAAFNPGPGQQSWGDRLRSLLPDLQGALRQNILPSLGIFACTLAGGGLGWRRRLRAVRRQDVLAVAALSVLGLILVWRMWQPAANGAGLVGAGILPSLAFAGWRWGGPRFQGSPDLQEISRLYLQLRRLLADHGVEISAAQGPEALISQLQISPLVETEGAIRVIQRYMEVRFGSEHLDPNELNQLWAELQRLRWIWHEAPLVQSETKISS